MWNDTQNLLLGSALLLQLVGLAGVFAARLRGPESSGSSVIITLLCFLVVGLATLVLLRECSGGTWFAMATTLPVMAVAATLDLKRGSAAAW